jgi:hypothetical protein
MNYELCLKLKEAGFKSEHVLDMDTGAWCTNCPWLRNEESKGFEEMCYPTLSELIEACGDKFKFIEIQNYHINQPRWTALDCEGEHRTFGSTPEEAVAKLWLALNKNGN